MTTPETPSKVPNPPKTPKTPKVPKAPNPNPKPAISKPRVSKPKVSQPKIPGQETPERKKRATPAKKPAPKQPVVVKAAGLKLKHRLMWLVLEIIGLTSAAIAAIIIVLGYSATWFSGTRFLTSLLPFAAGVLGIILLTAAFLIVWWWLRKWLQKKSISWGVPVLALGLAVLFGWLSFQDQSAQARGHLRTLLGGKQEAGRVTLAHQVYAAYRRFDVAQVKIILNRAELYNSDIEAAANAYDIDLNIMQGIAATESSFLPRESVDGGQGLFQITQVPKAIRAEVANALEGEALSEKNHRHNALLAAATFKYYLSQMHDDLFLGLLAYNIGPTNGGLRFIMDQYGATDFFTIQPYLQQLPRDYPIRVLSYALAFRLWQKDKILLAYEEGKNAQHIQSVGIPGLLMDF